MQRCNRGPWLPALAVILYCGAAGAGEIPGLRAGLPPFIDRNLELNFSNDFLGRGGGEDDFRTQQLMVTGKLTDRLFALVDHSILTLHDETAPGRTDQMTASVGYHLISVANADFSNSVAIGGGIRGTGDFAGESMQNGFHQLIGSDIESLPYTHTSKRAATVWIDAERYKVLYEPHGTRANSNWRVGYWLRANSLLTSDGQLDGSVAAYAVASHKAVDLWVGLRQDSRSGYDDPVVHAAAAAEEDLSVVLGARFGALVIETVQQTRNDVSYGQIRLVSSGSGWDPQSFAPQKYGVGFGFLLPDVQLQLGISKSTGWDSTRGSAWPASVNVDLAYGEPQYAKNTEAFVQSGQIGVALEWLSSFWPSRNRVSGYGNVGIGWRNQQVLGAGSRSGETSDSIGRVVLTLGTGLRFDAAKLSSNWRLRIQTGISAWIPVSDAKVELAGQNFTIQETVVAVFLGMTFDVQ